jgi:hypothetical protein
MAETEVRRRAAGAVLVNALLRWESLLTILVSVGLFIAGPNPLGEGSVWQPWFWLVAGGIAELALLISRLRDPDAAAEAVAREFETRYDLTRIKSADARRRVESAIEYRQGMITLVGRHQGAMKMQLQATADDINDWIGHMYDLALHIDSFESNDLVERDRRSVPQQIEKAKIRLERETDPQIRADLEGQISLLEKQLETLTATANSVKRAEIQLDNTLSSVATIYAQMSQLGTKEVDSSRAQRLRLEIQDEISGLQDTIHALDEVQSQRLRLQ